MGGRGKSYFLVCLSKMIQITLKPRYHATYLREFVKESQWKPMYFRPFTLDLLKVMFEDSTMGFITIFHHQFGRRLFFSKHLGANPSLYGVITWIIGGCPQPWKVWTSLWAWPETRECLPPCRRTCRLWWWVACEDGGCTQCLGFRYCR